MAHYTKIKLLILFALIRIYLRTNAFSAFQIRQVNSIIRYQVKTIGADIHKIKKPAKFSKLVYLEKTVPSFYLSTSNPLIYNCYHPVDRQRA